jgi:hypothetical protein
MVRALLVHGLGLVTSHTVVHTVVGKSGTGRGMLENVEFEAGELDLVAKVEYDE